MTKNLRNPILHKSICQTIQKLDFSMHDGGHLWFEGQKRSNPKISIKYGFLIPNKLENHILHESVDQKVQEIHFHNSHGGHLGFEGQSMVKSDHKLSPPIFILKNMSYQTYVPNLALFSEKCPSNAPIRLTLCRKTRLKICFFHDRGGHIGFHLATYSMKNKCKENVEISD